MSRYDRTDTPKYPRKDTGEYQAGYQLNKILRHHIGKAGNRATNHEIFRCNEGAWVLLEDLLEQDFLWYDGCDYGRARRHDQRQFIEIKRRRTGLIVDLAVAESRKWGKCRFQILGLRADSQEEFRAVKEEFQARGYRVKEPPAGANINDGIYDGWILPVAVRATSGHSYKRKNEVGRNHAGPHGNDEEARHEHSDEAGGSISCDIPIIPRVDHRQRTDARRNHWEKDHELLWHLPAMGYQKSCHSNEVPNSG